MKFLWTWGSLAFLATQALAQGVPADAPADQVNTAPIPFAAEIATDSDLNSAIALSERGRSALENAFVSEAVFCFNKALAIPNLDSSMKDSLNLDLVTAYLAEGPLAQKQAEAALQAVGATDTPAYLLRAALLQSRNNKWDGAAAQLAQIAPGKLSTSDLPWYFTAQARLAENRGDAAAAIKAWNDAIAAAPPLLRGQFEAALGVSQILLGKSPTPDEVEKLRVGMAAATIPALRAHFASQYAIGLDRLGQHNQALDVVTPWVDLPDLDHKNRDTMRLLMVYLDTEGDAPTDPQVLEQINIRDSQALEKVLQEPIDINSPDRDSIMQMQEQALSLLQQQALAQKTDGSPAITDAAAAGLKKFIDDIIDDPDRDSHPLLKKYYLLQANLALVLKQPDAAKTAANQLLEKFPPGAEPDPVVTDAQMLLAQVYWNDNQPRVAANYLLKVYNSLPDGLRRAPIARSLASLYYMNGDYRNAAEFYTNLLKDPDPNSPVQHGQLLLRAVESELRAGLMDEAKKIMDDPVLLADFTPEDRWRAEWTLLMAMRDQKGEDAYLRLKSKLDPLHGKNLLPQELYLRLLWLNASLAVKRNDPKAEDAVEGFKKEVEALTPEAMADLPVHERKTLTDLLPELDATALLLSGEAVVLAQPADATAQAKQLDDQRKIFEELRQKYADSESAKQSYLDEASELESQNKFTEAQRLYNTLTDKFPKSEQAPFALYLSALDAEKLDKTGGKYTEAINLLNTFMAKYGDTAPPLVYAADPSLIYRVQLEQADLERNINDDPKDPSLENAAELYALLIKKSPNDPLTVRAKVSRADCLFQLATLPNASPKRRQDAIDELKVLYNQASLPVDARVVVAHEWGNLLEYGSNPDLNGAADIYFEVMDSIHKDPALEAELDKSPYGRNAMLQCLVALKHIYETQKKDTEAASVAERIASYSQAPATPPAIQAPATTTTH